MQASCCAHSFLLYNAGVLKYLEVSDYCLLLPGRVRYMDLKVSVSPSGVSLCLFLAFLSLYDLVYAITTSSQNISPKPLNSTDQQHHRIMRPPIKVSLAYNLACFPSIVHPPKADF
jgi:hypothetical protein